MTYVLLLASLAAGGGIGYLIGILRPKKKPAPYTCTCGHLLSSHDPHKNLCGAQDRRKQYNYWGRRQGWEYVKCSCLRYVGDYPVDMLELARGWNPELPK